jgi:hypothetical protein
MNDSNACIRCGVEDEDLRTLFMSCFYTMEEIREVPFSRVLVKNAFLHDHQSDRPSELFSGLNVPVFTDTAKNTEPMERIFYTLRVCKKCRASWMRSIRNWYLSSDKEESPNTGIFVRSLGSLEEISEDEWYARKSKK